MGGSWEVSRVRDHAGDIHWRDPWSAGGGRQVWLCECLQPAVVLGSTQPESHVDFKRAAASGVEVARRRSGGGAVLVVPGETVWVMVAVPRHDKLWEADVGRAFVWLGEAWAAALDSLSVPPSGSHSFAPGSPRPGSVGGPSAAGFAPPRPGSVGPGSRASVHKGALLSGTWSPYACFAGLGPGEVSLDGRKVVGISQRRTREGALFHCAAQLTDALSDVADLFALDDDRRREAVAVLDAQAVALEGALGRSWTTAQVESALVAHLP